MKAWILIILVTAIQAHAAAPLNCDPVDMERLDKEINRINRRYDDFFEYRRKLEERQQNLQKGVGEVKIKQEVHAVELERARKAYTAVPKDYAKEEAMRLAWEEAQKQKLKAR